MGAPPESPPRALVTWKAAPLQTGARPRPPATVMKPLMEAPMRRLMLVLALFAVALSPNVRTQAPAQRDQQQPVRPPGPLPDWEDPAIVGRNKEAAHATALSYPDVASALAGISAGPSVKRDATPFYQ